MARTIKEIKKQMTDAFMEDADIRDMYGFKEGDTFEGSFSAVSLESILMYIVASCCYVLERIFDQFKADIDARINRLPVASVQWYRQKALEYQHGDAIYWDPLKSQMSYLEVDESKRVVKYAAVRDLDTFIRILVNEENEDGSPKALSEEVMVPFKQYINQIKVAGVMVDVQSLPPDIISITAQVSVDKLVINTRGELLTGGSPVVQDAIKGYLSGIEFGGVFNKNKFTAALLAVDGVKDVLIKSVKVSIDNGATYNEVVGNDYQSVGGAFALAADITNTISYG